MVITCDKCGCEYDDVYHWTYCPHKWFGMQTTVVGSDGKIIGVARSVGQLRRMTQNRHA